MTLFGVNLARTTFPRIPFPAGSWVRFGHKRNLHEICQAQVKEQAFDGLSHHRQGCVAVYLCNCWYRAHVAHADSSQVYQTSFFNSAEPWAAHLSRRRTTSPCRSPASLTLEAVGDRGSPSLPSQAPAILWSPLLCIYLPFPANIVIAFRPSPDTDRTYLHTAQPELIILLNSYHCKCICFSDWTLTRMPFIPMGSS